MCMWCDIKFTLGHICVRSQLYQLLIEDLESKEGEQKEFADYTKTLDDGGIIGDGSGTLHAISMQALVGTEGHYTMRMIGKINNQSLVILVDSGSTHNFMDQNTAKRVNCGVQMIQGLKVTVANGDILKTQEFCQGVC